MDQWTDKGYRPRKEIDELQDKKQSALQAERQSAAKGEKIETRESVPDFDPKMVIDAIKTDWRRLTWSEHNNLYSKCMVQQVGHDGKVRVNLDWIKYKDMKLKTCLKRWDIKGDDGKEIALSEASIDLMVPEIAQALLDQFEQITEFSEGDLKN